MTTKRKGPPKEVFVVLYDDGRCIEPQDAYDDIIYAQDMADEMNGDGETNHTVARYVLADRRIAEEKP